MNTSQPVVTENPVRVLIVDDDKDAYVWMNELLLDCHSAKYQTQWAASFQEGLQLLTREGECPYDVALIDYRLGPRSGLQLLKQAVAFQKKLPLIMITGQHNPTVDQESIESGAADYILKSELNAESLDRAIRHSMRRFDQAHRNLESERTTSVVAALGAACHELNNPLLVLLTHAQLLLHDASELQTKHREHVVKIIEQGNLLVDKIRKFNQIAEPVLRDYAGSSKIIDLQRSKIKSTTH